MGQPTVRALERRILALDRDAFVAFVAALWEASGWTVERDGSVVEAARPGETRRLLVLPPTRLFPGLRRAPAVDEPVDEVVSPLRGTDRARLPRGVPDAPVVDAEVLHERLCYAVDDAARERLLADHLGISPDAAAAIGRWSPPPLLAPRGNRAAVATIGVLLVVAGLLVLLAATGAIVPGDSSTGTVDANGPTTAGAYATSEAPVYGAQATCDRGPAEVVAVVSDAVRGPRLGRGLVVAGRFWNPAHVRGLPTGSWNRMMRSPTLQPFYDATAVEFTDPAISGNRAVVNATGTVNGASVEYAFVLSQRSQPPMEGCWVVDGIEPV